MFYGVDKDEMDNLYVFNIDKNNVYILFCDGFLIRIVEEILWFIFMKV